MATVKKTTPYRNTNVMVGIVDKYALKGEEVWIQFRGYELVKITQKTTGIVKKGRAKFKRSELENIHYVAFEVEDSVYEDEKNSTQHAYSFTEDQAKHRLNWLDENKDYWFPEDVLPENFKISDCESL